MRERLLRLLLPAGAYLATILVVGCSGAPTGLQPKERPDAQLASFEETTALPPAPSAGLEIVLKRDFIEAFKDRVTIDANFKCVKAAPRPHKAKDDGDLHAAGTAPEIGLPTVVEVMNATSEKDCVKALQEAAQAGTPVAVKGAWRIWCEHAGGDRQVQGATVPPITNTNPDHVFEIHPVTKVGSKSALASLRPISGYQPKDAERAFDKYEALPCKIVPRQTTAAIRTRAAGFNYVEFVMEIRDEPQQVVSDGRFVFADVYDKDGELRVRKRRMAFVKDSPPEEAVRDLAPGTRLHVLGMPRLNLALVSWRLANWDKDEWKDQDVLEWDLPYEIVIVGLYEVEDEPIAQAPAAILVPTQQAA